MMMMMKKKADDDDEKDDNNDEMTGGVSDKCQPILSRLPCQGLASPPGFSPKPGFLVKMFI